MESLKRSARLAEGEADPVVVPAVEDPSRMSDKLMELLGDKASWVLSHVEEIQALAAQYQARNTRSKVDYQVILMSKNQWWRTSLRNSRLPTTPVQW